MASSCWSYCTHGGVCELDAGHEGLHDSRYCTWTDDEAIDEEEADRRLIEKDPIAGPAIIGITNTVRALAGEDRDE